MVIFRILFAGINSVSFGILFNVRKQDIVWAGLCGMLGYATNLHFLNTGLFPASLFASFVITAYAEIVARVRKKPATVFLVSGLLPIVPGGDMYRLAVLTLQRELDSALQIGYNVILQIGGILIGIVLVSSIMKIVLPIFPTKKHTVH